MKMEKEPLNKIKSLMERMEFVSGGYTGLLTEEGVKQARTTERYIDKSERYVDLVGGLKPGKMFTFGYVNVADVEIPQRKVKTPGKRGPGHNENDFATFGKNLGEDGEIVNVIKLTMYNFPWQVQSPPGDKYGEDVPYSLRYEVDKPWNKQPSVDEKYGAWKAKRNELGNKFGVTFGKATYKTDTNNFGGGIKSYNGKNPNLAKNSYLNFNMHGINPFSTTYYLVFADGNIKQIDESKLKILTSEKSDGLKKLREAGATEEDLKILYGMDYKRFENSQILFVSGTDTDGYPTLLINENLSEKIVGKTGLSRKAITDIARERYAKITKKDQYLNETTRRQKAIQSISGKNDRVKTMAIISPENPMSKKYPERLESKEAESGHTMDFNRGRRDDIETYLTIGNFAWFRMKGKYENKEKSYIVYNISFEDAEHISRKYDQESFIFIICNNGEVTYQFWEKKGDGKYNKTHERSEYVDMSNADDFYSKISRNFKFQIPFFDGSDDNKTQINEHIKAMNDTISKKNLNDSEIESKINECIDSSRTGKGRYYSRGTLYGGLHK